MSDQANIPEVTESPETKRTWTYERRLAAGIVGKLAFEGELDDGSADENVTGCEFLIDLVEAQITKFLSSFGGEDYDLHSLLSAGCSALVQQKGGAK